MSDKLREALDVEQVRTAWAKATAEKADFWPNFTRKLAAALTEAKGQEPPKCGLMHEANQGDSCLYCRKPKVWWEYIGEELAIFWESPFGHGKEKIASFWWPAHPVEATAEVEFAFERIAEQLAAQPPAEAPAVTPSESLRKFRIRAARILCETRGHTGYRPCDFCLNVTLFELSTGRIDPSQPTPDLPVSSQPQTLGAHGMCNCEDMGHSSLCPIHAKLPVSSEHDTEDKR